ncbi:putative bzip transcription factor (ap-1) [Phaeomoniella chlamydospora]|uniref:Putative bzip transcription factor (Ap-1) n=1 Tax=Phaeomoniella chlamydospora TaxID=158046 RepID=A0A0G2EDX0_PHACM|nr:putative bzip transcription factor (ap-1) [Phaeomoniella chlamydospora]
MDESPYLDFDGEFDDSYNFDLNGDDMIGDLPPESSTSNGDNEHELHEKRKSVGGKDADDEGGGKRREGEDKAAKKPGRKPLTSEPTSKRKAQNRAAQRAFRDRKEKHLRDLETKVESLEKASESTNHENGLLRAQVERLQVELKEYRKRLSWVSNGGGLRKPGPSDPALNPVIQNKPNGNKNDFQFDFPRFGDLPSSVPGTSLSSPNGTKLNDFGLNTISENNQTWPTQTFGTNVPPGNDFNWLVQQNGGNFDPVLFNDYREPQDAIIGQDFGSFFNEAFPLPDLGSPLHNFSEVANLGATSQKGDLMKQVDAVQNGEDESTANSEQQSKMLTCNKIWDRLQSMEKFRNGEIDVDNLCSELRAKARCSEGSAVVEKNEVDKILKSAK